METIVIKNYIKILNHMSPRGDTVHKKANIIQRLMLIEKCKNDCSGCTIYEKACGDAEKFIYEHFQQEYSKSV